VKLYKRAAGTLRVVFKGKYRAQARMFSASQSKQIVGDQIRRERTIRPGGLQ
jgi:hypothetical protein